MDFREDWATLRAGETTAIDPASPAPHTVETWIEAMSGAYREAQEIQNLYRGENRIERFSITVSYADGDQWVARTMVVGRSLDGYGPSILGALAQLGGKVLSAFEGHLAEMVSTAKVQKERAEKALALLDQMRARLTPT